MAHPHECSMTSRSDLLSLLSQACEFEHALACSYLFTSFTLKQEISEGISAEDLRWTLKWKGEIFNVAAEEMLHLAQVWNILAAVGGNPYYWRPSFPIRSDYYPTGLPIELLPFQVPVLERFVQYETPDEEDRKAICTKHGIASFAAGTPPFGSVAELYTVISQMIEAIPESDLFIGSKERQVGEDLAHFPQIVKVVDRDSALAAVALIKEQGEGNELAAKQSSALEELDIDRDGHYGVFIRVRNEYEAQIARARAAGENFAIVRDVIDNPIASVRPDSCVAIAAEPMNSTIPCALLIQDEYTVQVAKHFDRVYLLMLRLLQYVFRNSTDDRIVLQTFADFAIKIMVTVIKPFGEALTLLPAGKPYGNKTAGPAFGLSRHVTLPENPHTATIVVEERLGELITTAIKLAEDERAPIQLMHARHNLEDLLQELQTELVA